MNEHPPILLDTCAAIWIGEDQWIEPEAEAAINLEWADDYPILLSPITAWEVGLLTARGRLPLTMTPERWFAELAGRPGVRLAEMTPEILIAASYLPGVPPNDPADRILAATARRLGCRLMTRDAKLLAYAASGQMGAIAC